MTMTKSQVTTILGYLYNLKLKDTEHLKNKMLWEDPWPIQK